MNIDKLILGSGDSEKQLRFSSLMNIDKLIPGEDVYAYGGVLAL